MCLGLDWVDGAIRGAIHGAIHGGIHGLYRRAATQSLQRSRRLMCRRWCVTTSTNIRCKVGHVGASI